MDWQELEIFKGIDLNDSFILNWKHGKDFLTFEIEASIWPESQFYIEPKLNEYTCYRKATLSFINIESLIGLKLLVESPSFIDADGSVDYGNIDSLQLTSDGFSIQGDFGSVHIKGGAIEFEVHI
jgi:hypothetical protein